MAYIKDYKDRLFLGRIAIHPERLSEASEDAQSVSVEPDGTLVLGEGGGEEPTTVTWDDVEDKPDFGTASEADVEDFAAASHTQAFTTITGTATAAQIPTLLGNKIGALTGLAAGTNAAIVATDTLLVALAKLQAQIDALSE